MDGAQGVGRALDVLSVNDRLGCDVIGLQETHRSEHLASTQAGYLVYCSGECGGENGGKKEQGGVGLAVRTSTIRPLEFISDRLLKFILELRGRAKTVTFFVAYAPTKHGMLVILMNMHSGRAWTELWRRYLNTNSCSC